MKRIGFLLVTVFAFACGAGNTQIKYQAQPQSRCGKTRPYKLPNAVPTLGVDDRRNCDGLHRRSSQARAGVNFR